MVDLQAVWLSLNEIERFLFNESLEHSLMVDTSEWGADVRSEKSIRFERLPKLIPAAQRLVRDHLIEVWRDDAGRAEPNPYEIVSDPANWLRSAKVADPGRPLHTIVATDEAKAMLAQRAGD